MKLPFEHYLLSTIYYLLSTTVKNEIKNPSQPVLTPDTRATGIGFFTRAWQPRQ